LAAMVLSVVVMMGAVVLSAAVVMEAVVLSVAVVRRDCGCVGGRGDGGYGAVDGGGTERLWLCRW